MFAARSNNENAIYDHQTTAAARPLNQGIKALQPKTPGTKQQPKTPFAKRGNDENAATGRAGKTGKDGGKQATSAFITPAAPRTRAPLTAKPTNARARTPLAPPTANNPNSARHTSPRLRRSKVKIHTADADPLISDRSHGHEEPEIEYMPPRGEPLPDHPDDCWPADRTYPQFSEENVTKGWLTEIRPQRVRDEGEEFEERVRELERQEQEVQHLPKKRTAQQQPSTFASRKAASALSSSNTATAPSTSTATPSFAAPTAAAKARRIPTASTTTTTTTTTLKHPSTRPPRSHTAARVASNTTLGYSRGRQVSRGTLPQMAGANTGAKTIKEQPHAQETTGGTEMIDWQGLGFAAPTVAGEADASGLGGEEADELTGATKGGDDEQAEVEVEDWLESFRLR
ncbi:hypothetical protein B0A50_04828 [Salinomyces thailandicus]|uniref:Uncharacterized protein n=1 Tax=Salinomyces thailandicus TaxID=706561 RepID=A0A4U0TZ46_9PEZI|nr:hypothetical protein B0A50_04828 [Salinomyces thailandica]